MLDKLIDFIITFIKDLLPFFIIRQWEQGVILRWGKFRKVVNPGLIWKIPFADSLYETIIITRTVSVPTQSLTTKDGKQIVVKSVVKFNIDDVKAFTLEVSDSKDAILDTAQAIIKEQVIERTWDECRDAKMDGRIAGKLQIAVKKWGISIEKVTLSSIGLIRSIRLFNETETAKNE